MVQAPHHLGLPAKALDDLLALLLRNQIGLDGLDGDVTLDAWIPGLIHDAHPTAAQLARDQITPHHQAVVGQTRALVEANEDVFRKFLGLDPNPVQSLLDEGA